MLCLKLGQPASDLRPATTALIRDWCTGAIKYYTEAPFAPNASERLTPLELRAIGNINSGVRDCLATKVQFAEPAQNMMEVDG